jgi:hypothetical protein
MADRTPSAGGLAVSPNGVGDVNNPAASVQEFQAHRFWGRWTTPLFLPNAASNAAAAGAYDKMRPGDVAFVESTARNHTLTSRGTVNNGDATWI